MFMLSEFYTRAGDRFLSKMEEFLSAACKALDGNTNRFVSDESAWVLGVEYKADMEEGMASLREDLQSRLWHTYRHSFPPLSNGDTSDAGWGCMLRCAQMMLAEAAVRNKLGRDWRWTPGCTSEDYCSIVKLFQDLSHLSCPFSLHMMTTISADLRKPAGNWLGSCTAAQVIKEIVGLEASNDFAVYNIVDKVFIVDEIRKVPKTQRHFQHKWDPLIIICPTFFGYGRKFNAELYLPLFQKFFRSPHCLGVLGGTPAHALYIVGMCGKEVTYLDPHTNQPSAPVGDLDTLESWEPDQTYHCRTFNKLDCDLLDPSCAMCFLCRTEEEFDALVTFLKAEFGGFLELHETRPPQLTFVTDRTDDCVSCSSEDEDDFVLCT